jgi:hypothetical protein
MTLPGVVSRSKAACLFFRLLVFAYTSLGLLTYHLVCLHITWFAFVLLCLLSFRSFGPSFTFKRERMTRPGMESRSLAECLSALADVCFTFSFCFLSFVSL